MDKPHRHMYSQDWKREGTSEGFIVNEPVDIKLVRARPTLLSRLRNYPSGDGIPNNLKNAVGVYLLLDPDDQ